MNIKANTRKLVYNALLCGITILLGFTPLGLLPLPAPMMSPTTVHIPVLVASLFLGYKSGLITACCFGLVSFARALQAPVGLSIFYLNPLTAILPRLMIPTIACIAYYCIKKLSRSDILSLIIAAIFGSLANTVFTLSTIYVFHGAELEQILSGILSSGNYANAGKYLLYAIAIPYGMSEALLSALVVPVIVKALRKAIH